MAIHYLNSNVVGGLQDGSSEANAWPSISDILAGDIEPGDTIRTSYLHSETLNNFTMAGLITVANDPEQPVLFISVDFGNSYAFREGAEIIGTSGAFTLANGNNIFYWRGFTVDPEDDVASGDDVRLTIEDMEILIDGQNNDDVSVGINSTFNVINCTYEPINSDSDGFTVGNAGRIFIDNLTFSTLNTSTMNNFINQIADNGAVEVRNTDLSICTYLVAENPSALSAGQIVVSLYRCKLNSSTFWSATLNHPGHRVEAYDCDSGTDRNGISIFDGYGQVDDDTGIYLDGTTDGTTGFSLKMVSTSIAVNAFPLRVHLGTVPISSATATLTVELVEDNATALQDDEFWIEIEAPGGTAPTGVTGSSRKMNSPYETPANLTSSTKTWTGTGGFTNEDKRKISLTLGTDTAAAFAGQTVDVYACLGPAAVRTVYVDPFITVS